MSSVGRGRHYGGLGSAVVQSRREGFLGYGGSGSPGARRRLFLKRLAAVAVSTLGRVAAAVVVAVVVGSGWGATSALAGPLAWSSPFQLDSQLPFAQAYLLGPISCPSTSLCVAVDSNGRVLTSTNPTGGATAWSVTRVLPLVSGGEPSDRLLQLSCPTSTLCVALTLQGVLSTTDPTAGANAWGISDFTTVTPPTSLSCPTASFCAAVNNQGNLWTTGNPAGGWSGWAMTTIPSATGTTGISCSSSSLCVAIDSQGDVFTSSSPASAASWIKTNVDSTNELLAISCSVSPASCVAVDGAGQVIVSQNPGAITPTWSVIGLSGVVGLDGITCTTDGGLCLAIDQFGHVAASTNPSGGVGAWTVTTQDTSGFGGVACPSDLACVATDGGNILSTASPTAATANSWSRSYVDGRNPLSDGSCPSAGLCLAVDQAGNVLTTSTPLDHQDPWTASHIDNHVLTGISCTAALVCVAVDNAGDVVSSANPAGDATAWSTAHVDGSAAFVSISCATGPVCVAVDNAGNVVSSGNPTGGTAAWTVTNVINPAAVGGGLTGISCASATLCVATYPQGHLLVSTNPTGPAGAWTPMLLNPAVSLGRVACPSTTLCLVTAGQYVVWSANPTAGPGSWKADVVAGGNQLQAIACGSPTLCVAAANGIVYASTAPTAGTSAWSIQINSNGPWTIPAAACAPTTVCILGDDHGNAWTGIQPPANTAPPTIIGIAAVGQTLTCQPGTWAGQGPITYTFHWQRNGQPIANANTNSYTPSGADAGATITCTVTATNTAGPTTITTSGRTIPAAVGTRRRLIATASRAKIADNHVTIAVTCRGPVGQICKIKLIITAVETIKAGKIVAINALARRTHRLTLASAHAKIPAERTKSIRLTLTRTASRLLARRHQLIGLLTVTQTNAKPPRRIARQRIVFRIHRHRPA
jgi:hypothetical protein